MSESDETGPFDGEAPVDRFHDELAMLADVRGYLRAVTDPGFIIPTTTIDRLLDQRSAKN